MMFCTEQETTTGLDIAQGTWLGDTLITVTGTNFILTPFTRCKFGTGAVADSAIVVGSYVSASEVKCVTPAHTAGTVSVLVANNAQDFSSSGPSYLFNAETVQSVYPISGPTTGGSRVTVTGQEFITGIVCKFGTLPSVTPLSLSSTQAVCLSPAHAAGLVYVEVSSNDQTFTDDRVEYVYYGK